MAPSSCGVCCLQINNAGISGVDRDPVLFAAVKDKVPLISRKISQRTASMKSVNDSHALLRFRNEAH